MGKDAHLKLFFEDRLVFASVTNYALRLKKNPIVPEQLLDCSTEEQLMLENGVKTQFRDLAKYVCAKKNKHTIITLVAIELQTYVDNTMPVRVGKYDFGRYDAQIRYIAQQHRDSGENAKHSSGEFLTAFYKEDKLLPVITIVVYLSSKKWDGPESLHQILRIDDPELLKFVPDYKFILVQPANMSEEDLAHLSKRAELLMGAVKNSGSKAELLDYMQKKPEFKSMDNIAAQAIGTLTGVKVKAEHKGGTVNMCEAVREIIDDSKEEGRKEGRLEGLVEGEKKGVKKGKREGRKEGKKEGIFVSQLNTIRKLRDSFKWTLDQAMEFLAIPSKERDSYLKALAQ